MSNSTGEILKPLADEVFAIDYRWVALESVSDLFCLLLAIYLFMPGLEKIVPSHPKYPEKQRIFVWLAFTWGVRDNPRLFQFLVGLVETAVAIGLMACFLPDPTAQLIACLSLITAINLCAVFFITLIREPWKKKGVAVRQLVQAGVALWIRLHQDLHWDNDSHVFYMYAWIASCGLVSTFMLYRRIRYGKAPDPLLGK